MKVLLKNAAETEAFAKKLVKRIQAPALIFLEGALGTGKTTFTKGFLLGLGCFLPVKSPTYTLIETYLVNDVTVLHADLYRLKDSHELEEIGFRDYIHSNTIAIIEWASRAHDWLPKPDLICTFELPADGIGRYLTLWQGKESL